MKHGTKLRIKSSAIAAFAIDISTRGERQVFDRMVGSEPTYKPGVVTDHIYIHVGVWDPESWVIGCGWELYDWCAFYVGLGPLAFVSASPESAVARFFGGDDEKILRFPVQELMDTARGFVSGVRDAICRATGAGEHEVNL